MKLSKYTRPIMFSLLLCFTAISCRKFIEVDPPATSVNEGNVYEFDGTAISAVVSIYANLSNKNVPADLSFYPELSADNLGLLDLSRTAQVGYFQNKLLANDGSDVPSPWYMLYPSIFTCNAAIEGLTESKSVTPSVKQNLLGQAYFLRAFLYFYLTNFYGDVPLALTTDFTINNSLIRTPVSQVYNQIVSDLQQAQSLLPEKYLMGDMTRTFPAGQEQRVTANRFAASALLARVYLYQKDYANAEAAASEVINKSDTYSSSIPLDQVFLKNSKETIWGLQPVGIGSNSGESEFFVLRPGEPTPNSSRSIFLSSSFLNTFQLGDQRKQHWVGVINTDNVDYWYPAKYKALTNEPLTEQSILLRLGEQYLIRAEARIQQNKVAEGIADLNVLRDRAIDKTNPDENQRLKLLSTSLPKEAALAALSYERRIELFAEGGHRWFDLKRSGQIDAVMVPATALKGGSWTGYKALYPIPSVELRNNTKLSQNDGYTN